MEDQALLPQVVVQELFVIEGSNNQIFQQIQQNLIFIPFGIPELEIGNVQAISIQDIFAEPDDLANVEQSLVQAAPQFGNRSEKDDKYRESGSQGRGDRNNDPILNGDFILNSFNDAELSATQLALQTADILGDRNTVLQDSQQVVFDLLVFDDETANGNLFDFARQEASDVFLDALQFALQDVIIEGSENIVEQSIEQTLITFVAVDAEEWESFPTSAQFAIQETFLGDGLSVTDANAVTQQIVQSINVTPLFADDAAIVPTVAADGTLTLPDFDIDGFINSLLGGEVALMGQQESFQDVVVTGVDNNVQQSESQTLLQGVRQDRVVGGSGDDTFAIGPDRRFDGVSDTILTGSGNDRIDLRIPIPTAIPSQAVVFSGSGHDELLVGGSDSVSAGSGDDILRATGSAGGNRLSGGSGNDTFFLSTNDLALGGTGRDRFYVGLGGNNTIVGGAGADEFWLTTEGLPAAPNRVVDFEAHKDRIGLAGLGIGFADLSRNGNEIALGETVLAILPGIDTETVSPDRFIFT